MMTYKYVNEDEKFWDHSYNVSFASCLGWDSAICVNADNEQEAVDFAADHAQEQGWVGYFIDDEDLAEHEEFNDVLYVGNCGWPIQASELHVEQLD